MSNIFFLHQGTGKVRPGRNMLPSLVFSRYAIEKTVQVHNHPGEKKVYKALFFSMSDLKLSAM